jgi:hypothetical protein
MTLRMALPATGGRELHGVMNRSLRVKLINLMLVFLIIFRQI